MISGQNYKKLVSPISSCIWRYVYYLKFNITVENIALHFKSYIMPILFAENSFNIFEMKVVLHN